MVETKDKAGNSRNRREKTESRKIRIYTAAKYYINVSRSFEDVAKFVSVQQATLEKWSKTEDWQAALKFWGFTGQKLRTLRKVKTPRPEVPYTLTERYLLKEAFQDDGDIIRFVTYNGLIDANVEGVEVFDIQLAGRAEPLQKHDVLLAFPRSRMAYLKHGIKRRKSIAEKSLGPIVKRSERPQVHVRAKIGDPIECIMRNGLVIAGKNIWISKYNIVLRVGGIEGESRGKVALIYRHGLLEFKRFEPEPSVTVDPEDSNDDWDDE